MMKYWKLTDLVAEEKVKNLDIVGSISFGHPFPKIHLNRVTEKIPLPTFFWVLHVSILVHFSEKISVGILQADLQLALHCFHGDRHVYVHVIHDNINHWRHKLTIPKVVIHSFYISSFQIYGLMDTAYLCCVSTGAVYHLTLISLKSNLFSPY